MKPNIPLSAEQFAFLDELNCRLPNINYYYNDYCKRIADNGGARDIYRTENGKPVLYLRRHYIYRGPEREAMIHQFFMGDKGPLHDHPADSWGSILSVGYNERLCTHIDSAGITQGEYEISRLPRDWSYRPASNEDHSDFNSFHKVKLRDPASDAGKVKTLFIMEKRNNNSWGFRENDGKFTPYQEMNKKEKTDAIQSEADNYSYGWFPKRVV